MQVEQEMAFKWLCGSPSFLPSTKALSEGHVKNRNLGFPGGSVAEIHLPRQETLVQSLIPEDPTCFGETKPHAAQLLSLGSRARESQLLSPCVATTEAHVPSSRCSPAREATAVRCLCAEMKSSPCSPHLEEAQTQQLRPSAAKNLKGKKKKEQKSLRRVTKVARS